jgi:hypothetical protein
VNILAFQSFVEEGESLARMIVNDRAAAVLGENRINIDYSYRGVDPETNRGLLVFGVDHLTKAANLLDELAV